MYKKDLYKESLIKWGFKAQKGMFIEEMGEVLTALNKVTRFHNGCSIEELLNEFADMEILLEEMKFYYDIHNKFDEIKILKFKHLEVLLMDKKE